MKFSRKTFTFFEQASKHSKNLKWYDKNRPLYLDHVRAPFEELVHEIQKATSSSLPGIVVNPKAITRPLRPKGKAEDGELVKDTTHITLWEKRTSLFEWNPAIHIQFGAKKDDNFVGLGLYMVSGRQMSLLRNRVHEDYDEIHKILNQRKFKSAWGGLQGEKFKRFPKGFDPEGASAEYLWHKQFYVSQQFSKQEIVSKNFSKNLIKDLKIAMPFFAWVRAAVGTYSRSKNSDY